MSTADHWLYSLNDTGTQGLIVDAEGFTVMMLQSHWADLETVMALICREHNRQVRETPQTN
jgi:hypothetical protein